jgi:large subunit ribosomal protein L4e
MKNTKLKVMDAKKAEVGSVDLPVQFSEAVRPDIIKRAVHTIDANTRQPYGSDPEAGKKASAKVSRRRRDYRGSYGHGISRVPRKVLSVRGTRFNWVGANAPGMRKGRRAHPPKAEKVWEKKINIKEKRKAIRSAMSATLIAELVEKRGHQLPAGYPFIIDSSFEKMSKTKDVMSAFSALGLDNEFERTSTRTVRAGRGTMRGRKYKSKVGPLVVVSDKCELFNAAKNLPGVDVAIVSRLNASVLAPGADCGRLTLWTKAAVEKVGKDKLFM